MSDQDEAQLQAEVDAALESWSELRHGVTQIRLDNGSDVTNLSINVDVRVEQIGQPTFRFFSVVVGEAFVEFLGAKSEMYEPFTTGGPLIIVPKITGKSVVQAVMRYLLLEQHRRGS